LSSAFFTLILLMAIAASPPVDVALPAIRIAVVKQTGHMGSILNHDVPLAIPLSS